MFFIRPSRLVPLAAAAALSLSACGADGGDDAQADAVQDESSAPAEPTDEPTDEPADEPSETPTEQGPEADLPDGWTLAEADEFSIGLPPGWFSGQRALNDEEFMAEVASEFENMTDAEVTDAVKESIGDLDLLAFKTDDFNSGFSTNINVIAGSRGPFDGRDAIRELAPAEIETIGATSIEVDDYEVNGMPGVELTYELPDVGVKGIQNYLLAEDTVVIATFTGVETDPELWQSVLETVEVAG